MDPLSAIGLASNILQFIEFGANLCVTIHEVASSATGSTQENAHIEVVAEHLSSATDGLSASVKGNSKHEAKIVQLAGQCKSLSVELGDILSKLKAKKGDRLWGSVRTALKSTLKEKKVASIERRLASYRQELILQLNLLLYDEQSSIKEYLRRIERQALDLGNQHGTEIKAQNGHLRVLLQKLDVVHAESATSSSVTACHAAIQDVQASLTKLHSAAKEIPHENDVLRALYFSSMFRREDSISSTVGETYRWLLQSEEPESEDVLSIRDTNESVNDDSSATSGVGHGHKATNTVPEHTEQPEEQTGHGSGNTKTHPLEESNNNELNESKLATTVPDSELVSHLAEWDYGKEKLSRQGVARRFKEFLVHEHSVFFIHGKTGSGKSTLMKYLTDTGNSAVRRSLLAWKGSCHLIRVSVFFWNAGESLQKSLEGLYRSILYQTLRELPELVKELFENTTAVAAWQDVRLPFLETAIDKLFQILDAGQHKLCFFIDGLDEYEGDSYDQVKLAKTIFTWGRQCNVKIVCSARPHQEYMQVFTDQKRQLPLHSYTKGDILEYALTIFQDSAGSTPHLSNFSLIRLANEIAQLAEGVFLWAYLIVRSLSQKLQTYAVKELHEMLRNTPRNLDTFFDKMLEKVDPLTQKQTEEFLLIAAYNPSGGILNAMSYSWLEELRDPMFPFANSMCSYSDDEIERRLELVKSRVRDLTKGMLEVKQLQLRARRIMNGRLLRSVQKVKDIHPFYRYVVNFFHRTFRDYLLLRWNEVPAPSAETYVGLALAEVKFSCSMEFYSFGGCSGSAGFKNLDGIMQLLFWLERDGAQLSIDLCIEIEKIVGGYEELLNSSVPDRKANPAGAPVLGPSIKCRWIIHNNWTDLETKPALRPFSFLSFMATRAPVTSAYIIDKIMEQPSSTYPEFDLADTLVAMANSGWEEKFLPYFIEKGVTPNTETTVWLLEDGRVQESTISVWLAAVGSYTVRHMYGVESDSHFWRVVENFLRVGADPDMLFLVVCNDHEEGTTYLYRTETEVDEIDEDKVRYLDLAQLIEIMQPPNVRQLRQLVDRPPSGTSNWWSGVASLLSSFSSVQPSEQYDFIDDARKQYTKWSESDDIMREIVEVRTKNYLFPRNGIIQIY